jgi:hypothetical protein
MSHTIKPLFVYVNWSENGAFKEKSLMDFEEFERACFSASADLDPSKGYDKTSIQVLFSDGSQYGARVDLNFKCRGFKEHAQIMIEGRKRLVKNGHELKNSCELTNFLETITF